MSLPHNIARCPGVGEMEDGVMHWREGCDNCLRRTAPWAGMPGSGIHMEPPPIFAFECEYRIGPDQ